MATVVEKSNVEALDPKARKAIWGAFVGFFIDMFDVYLPVVVLAPAIIYFVSPELSASATAIVTGLIFASTLLGRPLGALSQRTGRRLLLMVLGGLMTVVGTFLYYILISTSPDNFPLVVLLTTVIVFIVSSNWGMATSYINERFQTGIRASGFGLGYSVAVILPSFYAFYQAGLTGVMPFEYTVLPLLVVGGLLIVVGAALGPETKDVDFASGKEMFADER